MKKLTTYVMSRVLGRHYGLYYNIPYMNYSYLLDLNGNNESLSENRDGGRGYARCQPLHIESDGENDDYILDIEVPPKITYDDEEVHSPTTKKKMTSRQVGIQSAMQLLALLKDLVVTLDEQVPQRLKLFIKNEQYTEAMKALTTMNQGETKGDGDNEDDDDDSGSERDILLTPQMRKQKRKYEEDIATANKLEYSDDNERTGDDDDDSEER